MAAPKPPQLESGLMMLMQSLDTQIAREVTQRDPRAREEHGVQKWEPIDKRIERVSTFVLDALGDNEVKLDSILVLSQAFVKILCLVSDELGEEGLGEIRVGYVREALRRLAIEIERVRSTIDKTALLT